MPASRYLLLAFVGVLALLVTTTWTRAQTQRWTPLTEPVVVSGTRHRLPNRVDARPNAGRHNRRSNRWAMD